MDSKTMTRLAAILIAASMPLRSASDTLQSAALAWDRGDYVSQQGWATMLPEKQADSRVARECASRLLQ